MPRGCSCFTSIRDVAALLCSLPDGLIAQLPDVLPSRDWIAMTNAPLLELHGSADQVVPVALGGALFEAAPSTDKKRVIAGGAGHVTLWQPSAQDRLFAFPGRLR